MPESPPFILTLKLSQSAFDLFDNLRQQHFPAARNFLPAHITLFHALPSDQELVIRQDLESVCSKTAAPQLAFPKLRFLGKGVAVEVDSPRLTELRKQLAAKWGAWLTAQDRQGYRPHVTIQNKVAPEQARQLYDQLAATWNSSFAARGEGLLLWRYQGGPWEFVGEFLFSESTAQ